MKKIVGFIAFWVLLIEYNLCIASTAVPVVNVLSWWGYLEYPEITKPIEKKCGVQISFDEYFSNNEFLHRWRQDKEGYQIIIFSNTIYNSVKDEINTTKSELWEVTKNYHPVIKQKYKESQYPHNTVYFIHSLTGFLWNPNVLSLSESDDIYTIFQKANGKIVVIPDDPVEASKLISLATGINSQNIQETLSEKNFEKIVQAAIIYITNDYSKIYDDSQFAFSFTWSGEAVIDIQSSKKPYKFLIHPQLSYISSDLITQLSNKPYVSCVARELAGERTMNILQNKDFYFSSYMDISEIDNDMFKGIYKKFIENLPSLQWIDTPLKKDIEQYDAMWGIIKLGQ